MQAGTLWTILSITVSVVLWGIPTILPDQKPIALGFILVSTMVSVFSILYWCLTNYKLPKTNSTQTATSLTFIKNAGTRTTITNNEMVGGGIVISEKSKDTKIDRNKFS